MRQIGLTGGIGAGKSVVASRLAEHGAVIIDSDVLAREVVEPGTPALEAIATAFGPGVIAADGSLDRAALGAIIFEDAGERAVLNSITHPAIRARARELVDRAAAADPSAIVVHDIPLLVETGAHRTRGFDEIVVVSADVSRRRDRLVRLRGMGPDEADRRIASQASEDERLAIADAVIDTNGSVDETLLQVDALWERLTKQS